MVIELNESIEWWQNLMVRELSDDGIERWQNWMTELNGDRNEWL